MDVHVKITHRFSSRMKSIDWKVTKEAISVQIIERRVLQSLGGGNKAVPTATRDTFGKQMDVGK